MREIVFLCGTLCDARLFAPQTAAMEGRANVVVPSMDGGGDDLPAFAARLLDGLPPKFDLAGLSLGGIVAMEMMRQQPQRIGRAALLDTNADADSEEGRARRAADFARAESEGLEAFIRGVMLPRQLHADALADDGIVETMAAMAVDVGMAVWKNQLKLVAERKSAFDVLASCNIPLLIGYGDDDRICTPEAHARMTAAAREGQNSPAPVVYEFSRCGHICTLERAAAAATALEKFFFSD